MVSAETTIADCLHLICARYVAVPGLSLTRPEVERLWRLDAVSSTRSLTLHRHPVPRHRARAPIRRGRDGGLANASPWLRGC